MRPGQAARALAARFNGDRVSRAEIAWALPRGSRRARCQGDWLKALARDPELAREREPYQSHIREIASELARRASWDDRTTMLPRAEACAMFGFSVTTWKKCRKWLEGHGYLGTVRKGRLAGFRRVVAAVLDTGRNDAAVYVLAMPARPKRQLEPPPPVPPLARPPSCSRSEQGSNHTGKSAATTGGPDFSEHRVLKNLSDKAVAHFWRPFAAAGWTPRDLVHAINHWPDGVQHRRDLTDVLYPAGWLRWRLSWWLIDGVPVSSRSQRWARIAAADRAARAQLRAERAAAAAAATPPNAAWAAAKSKLRAQRSRK
jgi:hypothetical protein